MADLNRYDVDFGDFKTQMKLSDEDAESYGDRASKVGSIDVRRAIKTHHGIQLDADPYASSGQVPEEDQDKNRKAISDEKQAEAPKNKARTAPSKA